MTGILQGVIASIGGVVQGQEAFTTAGTFTWVAPAGVSKVSVVTVGTTRGVTGSGNGGGALSYKNNITVVPGTSYTVVVGSGSGGGTIVKSSFINNCTVSAGIGNVNARTGDGGGCGGTSGAGGYSGNGGNLVTNSAGTNGAGGGGGGGGYFVCSNSAPQRAGGGGGVGILGAGSSGTGGSACGGGGGGGSGGNNGVTSTSCTGGDGGDYGGRGGWGFPNPCFTCLSYGTAGNGAVRIIWPGCARSFPSTNTGNV